MTHRHCSDSFRPRFRPNTADPERGCTTLSTCATSGPAGCCGHPRGHHCIEPHMNIGTIVDAAAAGEQCSGRLADSGLAGKRVAVVDVGSVPAIATMLGAARIGGAAALMNPALTPPELRG